MLLPDRVTAPVVYAAFVGNLRALRVCMVCGSWDTYTLDTALVCASMMGHLDAVRVLLDSRKFSANTVSLAFSHALVQDKLDVCMFLNARNRAGISISTDDIEQLVEMDRVNGLRMCFDMVSTVGRRKLFSERLFHMACLCTSFGVVEWYIGMMEAGVFAEESHALMGVLRVRDLHKFVPRLLGIGVLVSDESFEYAMSESFRLCNPLCSQHVLRARTHRRWSQIRGVFWFVVAYRRWFAEYYSVEGKGFRAARQRFAQYQRKISNLT